MSETPPLCEVCGERHLPWPLGRHIWRPAAYYEREARPEPNETAVAKLAPSADLVAKPEAAVNESVAKPQGGRPRIYPSDAQRQRAYRDRAEVAASLAALTIALSEEATSAPETHADNLAERRRLDGLVH